MEEKKPKMPRFNLTWLYVVIAVVLGVLMLNKSGSPLSEGGSMSRRVDYTQFQKYVAEGYASRIVVDKKDGSVLMYVTGEHVRDVFKTSNPVQGRLPYVEVEVPSMDKLQDFIEAQQQLGNFTGAVTYQRGSDGWINFFWRFDSDFPSEAKYPAIEDGSCCGCNNSAERLHIICENFHIFSKLVDDGIHEIIIADKLYLLSLTVIHPEHGV